MLKVTWVLPPPPGPSGPLLQLWGLIPQKPLLELPHYSAIYKEEGSQADTLAYEEVTGPCLSLEPKNTIYVIIWAPTVNCDLTMSPPAVLTVLSYLVSSARGLTGRVG